MKLVLASSNAGKLAELRDLLGDPFELHAQSEFGVTDADETGVSFVENAILKARHAAQSTGLSALGDDSGLCVDALDREESCGAHFRAEHQRGGEAARDDKHWAFASAWQIGPDGGFVRHHEPLAFETVPLTTRDYA